MAAKLPLQWDQSQLKENARHGSLFFPFKYYSTSLIPVYPEVPIHWHPEMELTMIMDGSADYTIDFQDYHVSAGDIICIQPNLLHAARTVPKGSMRSDSFVFHLDLLANSPVDLCAMQYLIPIMEGRIKFPHMTAPEHRQYPALKECFASLTDCCKNRLPGYELEVKSLLCHFIYLLLTNSSHIQHAEDVDNAHSERLKSVFTYLHENYTEDITVEDAAKICHITPSHFMHYFKEKSGMTFNRYLNQYRLTQAALLLAQGTPAAEAAFNCGFNNLPYFYKRFREYYHMTPKEFQGRIGCG